MGMVKHTCIDHHAVMGLLDFGHGSKITPLIIKQL